MTVYGSDLSNYDWGRGNVDLAAYKRAGINFVSHKCAEGHPGFYKDAFFKQFMDKARPVNFPVVGSYFVNHPGTTDDQAGWWFDIVNTEAPWWRDHPCFIWQLDAELFQYMARKPNVAECNAICVGLVKRGVSADKIIGYLPGWLYSSGEIASYNYKWWESGYHSNPATGFKAAYPGDSSDLWNHYGKIPTVVQYGSRGVIGNQNTCDVNAVRVNTVAELQALFGGDDMPTADEVAKAVWEYAYTHVDETTGAKNSKSRTTSQWLTNLAFALSDLPTAAEVSAAVVKALPGVNLTPEQIKAVGAAVAAAMPASVPFKLTGDLTPNPTP